MRRLITVSGFVVNSLNDLCAACVADALHLSGLILNVIRISAALANASAGHSCCDSLVRNVDLNNLVDVHAHLLKRLSLCNSSGEAVENEAVLCVVLAILSLRIPITTSSGTRSPLSIYALAARPAGVPFLHRLAEHIASGDSRDIQLFADYLSLGTLTCARSA